MFNHVFNNFMSDELMMNKEAPLLSILTNSKIFSVL